jgi:hypothetical protein
MKKAIVPPALLTVATNSPLSIIATRSSATVIKENNLNPWSASKIISINSKTGERKLKGPDNILITEPEWYNNYE